MSKCQKHQCRWDHFSFNSGSSWSRGSAVPQLPPCVFLSLVLGSEVGLQTSREKNPILFRKCFTLARMICHPNSASATLQILKEVFLCLILHLLPGCSLTHFTQKKKNKRSLTLFPHFIHSGHGLLVDLTMIGVQLDLMILKVFPNFFCDSMVLSSYLR